MALCCRLGRQAKLYKNDGTYAAPSWTEIKSVIDATINQNEQLVDCTDRGSGDYKEQIPNYREVTVDVTFNFCETDSDLESILNAADQRSVIEIAVASGDIAASGTRYLRMHAYVTNVTYNQPAEDRQTVSAQFVPAPNNNAQPAWVKNP